jgi:hypothetical protein
LGINININASHVLFQKKQDYLEDLKTQMAVKEEKRSEEKKHLMEETFGQDTDRKNYQDKLIDIREKKLKQLRFVQS